MISDYIILFISLYLKFDNKTKLNFKFLNFFNVFNIVFHMENII